MIRKNGLGCCPLVPVKATLDRSLLRFFPRPEVEQVLEQPDIVKPLHQSPLLLPKSHIHPRHGRVISAEEAE